MKPSLSLATGWRLKYDYCHGCGEKRDVASLWLHGALLELDFNICRYCARELRHDTANIELASGWIEPLGC